MELLGKTITQLGALVEKKEVTPDEISTYFKKRIEKHNPALNAYVTLAENAESKGGGILSGIPLAIKDNFCTKGLRTTASAKLLDQFVPPYNATVINKLEQAGAAVLGKTNMDAWAHGSSTETSDYGASKNPWDVTRAPGGSSGGSAVVVSSYLAPAAIGSETAGSIRLPAAWCGIVGLKPTYGRVSRYGVIAMGSSLDCPGPMTLNIEDAALLFGVIAGKDEYDATTSSEPVGEYRKNLDANKKYTIGIPAEYFEGVQDEVRASVESAIKIMEKQGHTVKKIKLLPPKYSISVYTIIQRAEVSSNLGRYDGVRYGEDRTLFGAEAKRRIMLGTYTLAHGYYDAYYKKAQRVRTLIIEDFKNAFKEVDIIAGPTAPSTALKIGEFEKYPFFGEMMDVLNEPSSIAGLPALHVPIGMDSNNLPIGMQLIGNYFNEQSLLNVGYQFEKETNYFGVVEKGLENYKD